MADPAGLTRHLLLGEDHPELGHVATVDAGPGVALALSAGRLPKPYQAVDPNEDALVVASRPGTTLVAVADGHHGFDAARASVVALHDHAGRLLVESRPERLVREAFAIAAAAVRAALAGLEGRRATSQTALTVAAVVGRALAVGTLGDTVAAVTGPRRSRVLTEKAPFLDPMSDVGAIRLHKASLGGSHLLVMMSDGAYGFLGHRWPRRLAELARGLAPLEAAQAVMEAAFAGGAGDHVAVAAVASAGP